MTAPRITPLPPSEWPDEMREAMAALRPVNARHPPLPEGPDRPQGLNALGLLARHPDLAIAYHTLNGHILRSSTLEPRERELLVLRVAAVRRAEYEWAQHAVLAGHAGLELEEVARVAEGPGALGWSELDSALLAAVDELLHDATVSDRTWPVLAAELDHQQLLDLVFTVGAYDMLAMAFLTFGVEIDHDLRGRKWPSL